MSSLADLPDLKGFFSYSRRVDELSRGSLSRLRAQIYNDLSMQLGFDFKLWQDTMAIPNGAEWEGEIKRAISESVFFIPIVSPNWVTSTHCRIEFNAFLDRERKLGRKNLIFPLLYLRVPALEKEELWRQDPVLEIIARRQCFDWQTFRNRSLDEADVADRLTQFCRDIVESLQQPWSFPAEFRDTQEAEAQGAAGQAGRSREGKKSQQVDAESRRQARDEHDAAAEPQRPADQEREENEAQESGQGLTEDSAVDEPQAAVSPARKTQKLLTSSIGVTVWTGAAVLTLCAMALLSYFVSELHPAKRPDKSVVPPLAVPACSSFPTPSFPGKKQAKIVTDGSSATREAAKSAMESAEKNGFTTDISMRPGLLRGADDTSLRETFLRADFIYICGRPGSELERALRELFVIR
jgi:hypothetical protein